MRGVYAKAKRVDANGNNSTEDRFEREVLIPRFAVKEILDFKRKPFSLDLGGSRYEPDFATLQPDGEVWLWEVKALHSDGSPVLTPESKAKLEITASNHWFRLKIAAWNQKNGWKYFDVTG